MRRSVGRGPWRVGLPPSVGWWPASPNREVDELRWFDGCMWGHAVLADMSAEAAARFAFVPTIYAQRQIEWRERADWWPERSKT
jgi:hypothetical protein